MGKKMFLATVLTGAVAGNYVYGADVSNWSGLKASDDILTLVNDINDPTTTATGNPIIKQNIVQTISGGENKYTIDGTTGGIDGFIKASTGADLTFENLTIQNFAKARFLDANKDANVTIQNSIFQNNSYGSNGGALYFDSTGKLSLTDVNFEGNSSLNNGGGALYFGKGSFEMNGGKFYKNNAKSSGGALQLGGGTKDSPSIVTLKKLTFEENTAKSNGGAFYIGLNNNTTLDEVTFKNNSSSGGNGGGAIYIDNANKITIKNSHFEDSNASEGDGGAIFLGSGVTTVIDNTTFSRNHSYYTGGAIIAATATSLKISNSEFNGNHALLLDSGALSINGTLDIYNTKFNGNYVEKLSSGGVKGGALWIGSTSQHSNIIASEFTGNYAGDFDAGQTGFGGAIYYESAKDSAIVDTSFTDNNHADKGGAIYSKNAHLNIFADKKDVIFSGNVANNDDFSNLETSYNGGGAIYLEGDNKGLVLNASANRKLVFDDTIASKTDSENFIIINDTNPYGNGSLSYIDQDGNEVVMGNAGEIQFNNYVGDGQGNVFGVNLLGGTLSIGQNAKNNANVTNPDGYINFNEFYISGDSILNTVNHVVGEFAPKVFEIDDVNWQYKFDVNLAGGVSDKLVGAENNGTLTISLAGLNIINDATDEETTVQYSDKNVNGAIDASVLTTSNGTYEVAVKNDTTGSYLVFSKNAEQIGGLAGAIKNQSDVYTITNGADEVVNKWSTNQVTNDLVVNANGYSITSENNLDGIIVAEAKALTINDVKDFSGFNNAFVVNENAVLNINNSDLTGNTGDAVILNNNGAININASNILTEQGETSVAIKSQGGIINVGGTKTVTIDGDITGSDGAKMNINTNTIITGTVNNIMSSQNSGNVTANEVLGGSYTLNKGTLNITENFAADTFTITGGTLNIANDVYAAPSTILAGGNINMLNGSMNNLALGNVTLNGTTNLSVDANLSSQLMDTISASNLEYNDGSINVNNINLIGQTNKSNVTMPFADDKLKAYVTTDVKSALGEIYRYDVDYDKNTGHFIFSSGGHGYQDFNPSVMAGAVAAEVGGYLNQLLSYDMAFQNIEVPQSQWQESGRYKRGWSRPYATAEHIRLKNGPKVTNKAYGSFFGVESELYGLGNGWEAKGGTYIGYNHSHQRFDNVNTYQKGGMLGVVGMAYKENLFTGITVNAGGHEGKEKTAYGKEDFSMFMAGVASKTGYNIVQADGNFIIQPNVLASYSLIDTSDYTNAGGVKIKADTLNALQIEPGVKLIGKMDNGYQPYSGVSMVWTFMDKTKFHANEVKLPELSVKPFAKYEIGVKRSWNDKMTGFVQCDFMSGGREGVSLQAGFSWALGK